MTVLIIGYPESGKSELAENMIMEMSAPGERIYLATMIPYGDEGAARIKRHRKMREGKGFETLEAPFDAADAFEKAEDVGSKTILLECLSNLVANELFERHEDSAAVIEKMAADMLRLKEISRDLVIVSNHYEIKEGFDEETVMYAKTLDEVNCRAADLADRTIRIQPQKK